MKNPEIIILDYHLNKDVKDAATGMEILTVIKKSEPGYSYYHAQQSGTIQHRLAKYSERGGAVCGEGRDCF
jgi:predicted extracellular nuclease